MTRSDGNGHGIHKQEDLCAGINQLTEITTRLPKYFIKDFAKELDWRNAVTISAMLEMHDGSCSVEVNS